MKISAKARYGLRILLDVALHETHARPRTIKEIADAQGISEKFISRIVVPLRERGMIKSERGKLGGFRLAQAPSDITLLAVIETLQGPISLVDCVADKAGCVRSGTCVARSVWTDVNTAVRAALRGMTLETVLERVRGGTSVPSALAEYSI
ncbi:MAG: Rrf2 family transcriptional regulator [bacterium]|nr:Rrf2 family transcriptional regulator [bacterium]MDO5313961.1 Rrf2 family transcriptional regulator [bacterium]